MQIYEALMVFKPISDNDNVDGLIRLAENNLQQHGAKITRLERMGRKKLAYEISKFKDGIVASLILEMPPESVKEFKKFCQMNEDILRLTLVKLSAEQLQVVMANREAFREGARPMGDRDRQPMAGAPRRDFNGPRRDFNSQGQRPQYAGGGFRRDNRDSESRPGAGGHTEPQV